MTHFIRCDGCGRTCEPDFVTTVEVTADRYAYGDESSVWHFCHARNGGSVGCNQFIRTMLKEIGPAMKARNEELDAERRSRVSDH